jgi:hypothetical protein
MAKLADVFDGKLAVYSSASGVGVGNFRKSTALQESAIVTQSISKFWRCSNQGEYVYLVFSGEGKSFEKIFKYFDGIRGVRAKNIIKDLQYMG